MTPSSDEEARATSRPMPCPHCQSTKGYNSSGHFRVTCRNCNSTVLREEVDMQLPTEESE